MVPKERTKTELVEFDKIVMHARKKGVKIIKHLFLPMFKYNTNKLVLSQLSPKINIILNHNSNQYHWQRQSF